MASSQKKKPWLVHVIGPIAAITWRYLWSPAAARPTSGACLVPWDFSAGGLWPGEALRFFYWAFRKKKDSNGSQYTWSILNLISIFMYIITYRICICICMCIYIYIQIPRYLKSKLSNSVSKYEQSNSELIHLLWSTSWPWHDHHASWDSPKNKNRHTIKVHWCALCIPPQKKNMAKTPPRTSCSAIPPLCSRAPAKNSV